MFEIIFLIVVSLSFLQLVVLTIGANKKYKKLGEEELPFVSVVVAARNEESNILRCMEALDKSLYVENKLEIIIVNDRSTDSTGRIIEEFIKDKPKFRTLIPEEGKGSLTGKANAIHQGILVAKGEVILSTDADCAVSQTWIKTTASYFTKDVSFVGGYTAQEGDHPFFAMQSIDFLYLLTVAGGAMNLGKPLSCIGNNMAYRKDLYWKTGGFEKIPFTVTEDFQLLMALHRLKDYKTIYPIDENSLVVSSPCRNLSELFHQKKRWGVGGLESDIIGFLVMAIGYLASLGVILTPVFFSPVSLYLALFKIFTDFFFILPVYNKLRLKLKFRDFLAFEIYFIIYVLALPFIVLPNRKVKWKGRVYNN